MGYIYTSAIGGILIMLFVVLDKELCIEPAIKKDSERMFVFILGLLFSLSGFLYGLYLYGW